jgi:hypothetical protein
MSIIWHLPRSSLPILFSLAATACPVHNSFTSDFPDPNGRFSGAPFNGGESSLDAFLSLESVPLAAGTEQKLGASDEIQTPKLKDKKSTRRAFTRGEARIEETEPQR